MLAKRPLLWLSPSPGRTLSDLPRLPGWEISSFDLLGPPPAVLPTLPDIRVGLLDLRQYQTSRSAHLEKWIESLAPATWAALLSQPPAEDAQLQSVIASHCADYHTWPCDSERLAAVLGHFWGMADLKAHINDSAEESFQKYSLSGRSSAIRNTRARLQRFAQTLEPVLIFGESGTGRTAAAHFIHRRSPVRQGPLVTVNCATLPTSLTQSELFGYEKGAFTHAFSSRPGRIEAAHGGTLLLLGIDELTLEQQSILLRFLQEGQVERIGSQQVRTVNARIIATSSTSLQSLIEAGRFRADVFYRLGGLDIRLPALRERLDDVPMLTEFITRLHSDTAPKPPGNSVRRRCAVSAGTNGPATSMNFETACVRPCCSATTRFCTRKT